MINTSARLITKLWVVSVIIEPLLFFVIADRTQVGLGLNIGRILQVLVIVCLFFDFLLGKSFSMSMRGFYCIAPYRSSIVYIYFATLCSILLGIYPSTEIVSDSKKLVDNLNSATLRPVIEGLITGYQFFYFLVLPLLLLKKKADFDFFFKVLFCFQVLHFSLGYLDFFFNIVGLQLIPRHFFEEIYVGLRWHGIAGEPRDAAVYNASLFFIITVYSIYKHGRITKINPIISALILSSLLLTFSASFAASIFLTAGLIFIFYFSWIKLKLNYKIIYSVGLTSLILFVTLMSARVVDYYQVYGEYLLLLYYDPYIELPYLIQNSFNNIYPIIFLFKDFFQSLNIYPLIFGYGIGSAGVVNINIYGEYYNPNNQLVRTVFEYGVVGTGLLILSIKKLLNRSSESLDYKTKRSILLMTIIMIGGILAHRSNVWLIWLGVLCAVSSYQNGIKIPSKIS